MSYADITQYSVRHPNRMNYQSKPPPRKRGAYKKPKSVPVLLAPEEYLKGFQLIIRLVAQIHI
jgi:hypothetical protein